MKTSVIAILLVALLSLTAAEDTLSEVSADSKKNIIESFLPF